MNCVFGHRAEIFVSPRMKAHGILSFHQCMFHGRECSGDQGEVEILTLAGVTSLKSLGLQMSFLHPMHGKRDCILQVQGTCYSLV